MSLFRKPSTKKIGLKVLVMGETGVGKSVFALSFPRVYAIDGECGMALYEGHPVFGKNLLGVANTQDFNELQEAIEEIEEIVEEDEDAVGTLVIDSETKIYQNLTDAVLAVEEKKARKNGKDVNDTSISIRGWGRVKAIAVRLNNMKIDLSAKGVNIVSIAQITDVNQRVGENIIKVGERPNMQKGSEYDYDIVLKLFVEDSNGNVSYKAQVLKDRTGVTKVGSIIDNPSYEIWKDYVESRQDADKIQSKLAKDTEKAIDTLEKQDLEAEKTVVEKLKEVMAKSEAHKAKALELIKASGIVNPLQPTVTELKKLEEIIATVSEM